MTSDVFRNSKDNKPPTAFNPIFPVYGTDTAVALKFKWEDSIDPDSDEPVTYDLTVSLDENFSNIYYQQKGMKNSFAVVDKAASLKDEVTYYWKVLASDVDGGTTQMGTATAATNNTKILGYVKDDSSDPIASVDISARMLGTSTENTAISDESGFFEVKDLSDGKYLLKASKESYTRYRNVLKLEEGETLDMELIMKKIITGEEGTEYSIVSHNDLTKDMVRTFEQRRSRTGLFAYVIGTGTASHFKPKLANGYPGFVKGFVFDNNTNGKINKATVAADGTKGSYKTAESGAYFLQVNSGTYTVSADASGYNTSGKTVRVDALSTTTENIGLSVATQPASVYGQVTDKKNGRSLEGATITVNGNTYTGKTTTDSGGNYSITEIESGKYQMTVKKTGYKSYQTKITLKTGQNKKLNVKLEKK
jgi:hypothetical protein